MMKYEIVKERVVEYLKHNGSANISELVRTLNCGRQTIYDVVGELEQEGKVTSELYRGKRIVKLVEGIPVYITVLMFLTAISTMWLVLSSYYEMFFVKLDSDAVVVVGNPLPLVILSHLTGFWLAVFLLKPEDLEYIAYTIKRGVVRNRHS